VKEIVDLLKSDTDLVKNIEEALSIIKENM